MILYLAIIWFLSGLLTGITSFGGNLIAIPVLALLCPTRDAILISCVSGWAIGLVLTLIYGKSIVWRDLSLLLLGFLCGMPIGVLFLKFASEKALMLTASVFILGFMVWQCLSSRLHVSQNRGGFWLATLLSFIGGTMLGAIGMGGPPIAFYALLRGWSKNETLGTLNALFVIFMVVLIPMQWYAGFFTLKLAHESLWGALFAAIGTVASVPIVARVNRRMFHLLLMAMITFSGIMLLARGIMA